MGNAGSSELDGTIRRIEDLKSKPAQLKVELHKFVQQVPLDHTFDVRADKKLFDILMGLVKAELAVPGSPDIHILMMTFQRLLRVRSFYAAIPRCSLLPLIGALLHRDPAVVLSALGALAWVLDCRCPPGPKFDGPTAELAAKQAFFESKGYETLINRVLVPYAGSGSHALLAKVVDMLALDLVDHCMSTRFVGIQKLLALLTPHLDLLLGLTTHTDLMVRCYSSILLQGFLLHSPLATMQQLQSKVLEEGHLLYYILFAIDGANLPSSSHYKMTLYEKSQCVLARNLLGLLCAGNPVIVEICVQKTIPRPLQVSLDKLNADSATNSAPNSSSSRNDRETIKNTLWNNFQSRRMKRVELQPQFARLDTETREPHILWTVDTKAELCAGLLREIATLRDQKLADPEMKWDYAGWQIEYKSLDRYLRVGGYYISILLPALGDKNSSYVIEMERIHMLLAALFQRSVVEDEPGWKLACLRAMAALYAKHGESLTRNLEILPYFAWLIDPKHTMPIYRDQVLHMLKSLLIDADNVKRFVRSGGVMHLLYYISRVLTLPDVVLAPVKGAKGAKGKATTRKAKTAEEEEAEEAKHAEDAAGSDAGYASAGGDEDGSASTNKQNLLVGLPLPLGVSETATLCLGLLRAIQLAGPRMARVMSEPSVVGTLARMLMCPVAGIKEDSVRLLLEILEHSAHLVPKLATTGLFSFLVYGLRGGVSPAVLELIGKYHMKQEVALVPAGESALSPYFPRALGEVLKTQGAMPFGELFDAREGAAGGGGSDLIWNASLKTHLFEVMSRRLGSFRALLVTEPFAEYKYAPTEAIRYPSLESELCLAGVFLRQLNETGGAPELLAQVSVSDPAELMSELVGSLNARRFAGVDLLNILTAQVIVVKAYGDLEEVRSYQGWAAIFEILASYAQDSEQEFPMIEKAAEIVHVLLCKGVQGPTTESKDDVEEDDENLAAFLSAKGLTLLTRTLEYFSSLKVNNVLIQRILIALLHCLYDLALRSPVLVAREFSSAPKKVLRRTVFAFLGRKSAQSHPMLSVVACKALMALVLGERCQLALLESGALLHLVDMSIFYMSAADVALVKAGKELPVTKGMDEEKRVRLAASSVLSLLAGHSTASLTAEPQPQIQRVLSALLTPKFAAALANPAAFVTRGTEHRARKQFTVLTRFIEAELIGVEKNGGEWAQKSWPFATLNYTLKPAVVAARAPAQFEGEEDQYEEGDPEEGDLNRTTSSNAEMVGERLADVGASIENSLSMFASRAKNVLSPAPAATGRVPSGSARPAAAAGARAPASAVSAAAPQRRAGPGSVVPAAAASTSRATAAAPPALVAAPKPTPALSGPKAIAGKAAAATAALALAASSLLSKKPSPSPPAEPQYEQYDDADISDADYDSHPQSTDAQYADDTYSAPIHHPAVGASGEEEYEDDVDGGAAQQHTYEHQQHEHYTNGGAYEDEEELPIEYDQTELADEENVR